MSRSRLNHAIVSAEITRLLTAQPDTRYTDIINALVLHLRCHPSTIRNSITKMRTARLVVGAGGRYDKTYRLASQGIKEAANRPKHASAIEQFIWEAGLI